MPNESTTPKNRFESIPLEPFLFANTTLLFVLAAWPLLLVKIPPFQDLPNHLASYTVIKFANLYPEFAFNGFFKTNSAFFAWLAATEPRMGLYASAKAFVAGVLLLSAFTLPRLVYRETSSRSAVVVASVLGFPLIHNWFVSAGMLDFALSVPLAVTILGLTNAQAESFSKKRALLIAGLSFLTWYAHSMGLLIAALLIKLDWLFGKTWRNRRLLGLAQLFAPLLPVGALLLVSIAAHVGRGSRNIPSPPIFHPVWELAYNLWAESYWSFTKLSIASIVPCGVLLYYGLRGLNQGRGVFAKGGLIALAVLAVLTPYVYDNWFHVNSRFFLFIWFLLLIRVPVQMPRWLFALSVVSCLSVSLGNGIDYVRLAAEQAEIDKAIPSVKEGARLLPLFFRQKNTSENTRNLIHAWGNYVVEKHTSAPLLFAHSRSFPITYVSAPPERFNHLILESTAARLRSPEGYCELMKDRRSFVLDHCREAYDALWREFWADATPRFDHVLMWDPSDEALANVPSAYRLTFNEGRVRLYARDPAR